MVPGDPGNSISKSTLAGFRLPGKGQDQQPLKFSSCRHGLCLQPQLNGVGLGCKAIALVQGPQVRP